MDRSTLALLELPRASFNLIELAASPWLLLSPRGDGHKVFVIPGMAASDDSTLPLRGWLAAIGYNTSGWQLGTNLAARTDRLNDLPAVFSAFAGNERTSIVGWSLGGLYARQLARVHPELVRQVICLGSPIGHDRAPLTVPCTSIYSQTDAVVPARLSKLPTHPLNTNVSVSSSHLGLGINPRVFRLLGKMLAPKATAAGVASVSS